MMTSIKILKRLISTTIQNTVKLMEANEKKKKDDDEQHVNVYYADFETDTTASIHKPYFVNVQSADGIESKDKSFQGDDCGVQLLDYLSHNSIIIFHNLAYDIQLIAKYGHVRATMKKGLGFKTFIKYKNSNHLV